MKKSIFMAFIVFVAGACEKESSELVKIDQDLRGTWALQSNKVEYYDSANNTEYEEVLADSSMMYMI